MSSKRNRRINMKKKYIFLIALVGVFLLGIFRYIDLNSRFPKAPTQAYGLGEWMPTGKAEICAVEAKVAKGEEIEACYKEEFGGKKFIGDKYKSREIIVKLKIKMWERIY